MTKYSFMDDYSEGCHPSILQALSDTNMVQQTAYGDDEYSIEAKGLLRAQLGIKDVPIYFVATGTLANIITTSCCLRSHEAVIAVTSGHMVVRETGAIEAAGHKIITVLPVDGKLTPDGIQWALDTNAHFPHMARPRMAYISNASETGTLYTKAELTALSKICKQNNLLLFLDGARLGAALAAKKNDVTLADIAKLTDIFWMGGTKIGTLLGEAIIIPNKALADDFAFHIKQRGSLLAKGRVLGVQFLELLKNDLWKDLPQYANDMAATLSEGVRLAGYQLDAETETNQVFPILPNALIEKLSENFSFYIWEKKGADKSVIRLVTSWATDKDQVEKFCQLLKDL